MREVRATGDALRRDLERLEASAALARLDLPRAGEIEAICAQFAQGAAEATPEERRAILDALQVRVTMEGVEYTVRGVVPEMETHGTLDGQTVCSRAS